MEEIPGRHVPRLERIVEDCVAVGTRIRTAATANAARGNLTPIPYRLFDFLDPARRAQIVEDAHLAARSPGDAHSPAMPDEQVGKPRPVLLRDETLKVALDLHGIVLASEAEALGEAPDVSVDDDSLRRAPLGSDDVGRLAADAGQAHEIVDPRRQMSVELLDEHLHRTSEVA